GFKFSPLTMGGLEQKLRVVDWESVARAMDKQGHALLPNILTGDQCEALIQGYGHSGAYRKTVIMERHRFGAGEYKYFDYPLPGVVQTLREALYPNLAPMANHWMEMLGLEKSFPDTLEGLQRLCRENQQSKPTPLILKYGKGGFNTLHQDLYGAVYFPMQAVLLLNDPERDFSGGEFVLAQQVPRAQSKAMVLRPKKGDMIIFTTNFRPVKGARGHYRANMRHGVSEVTSGNRHTL